MSSKASKRRHRRVNTTEEEPEKKTDETIEISDDNKSTISTDTEKTEKDTSLKELVEPESKKENGDQVPSPKKKDALETIENGQPEPVPEPEKTPTIPEPETINGQPSENGSFTEPQNTPEETSDIEPLVLEESEDPELQFPSETGSENSEIEKSPVLQNRCKTRRSQTRNLPTPKTPKALDYNGDEEIKNPKELRVNVTRLLPTPEVVDEAEINENVSVSNDNASVESSFSEKTQDTDLTNASIFVNLGDTTRNIDITTTSTIDDSTINASNFLDSTKDKTYGETLRCLTGRKTVRSNFSEGYKPRFYASNIDLTDSSKTYSPIKVGLKRKYESDSPGEQKKAKTDTSPGLFSYIASPFKTKVGRTEIPSSTPKLTSFKFVHQGSNIDEVQKVGVEYGEDKKVEAKKWCSIM